MPVMKRQIPATGPRAYETSGAVRTQTSVSLGTTTTSAMADADE